MLDTMQGCVLYIIQGENCTGHQVLGKRLVGFQLYFVHVDHIYIYREREREYNKVCHIYIYMIHMNFSHLTAPLYIYIYI